MEVTEILIVRMLFLIPYVILLIVGILMNKKDRKKITDQLILFFKRHVRSETFIIHTGRKN